MKKTILALTVVLGSTSLFAQKLETKNGDKYLPSAGDYAIGINANPFLSYVGNLIGGGQNANNAPAWNFLTTEQTITGKYFVEDNTAYRASLRIGFGSNKMTAMVGEDGAVAPVYPALPSEVEDVYKFSTMDIGLSVGIEKRRGFGRLQGFYGAELGVMFSNTKDKYTYGNDYTITGATHNDFGSNLTTDTYGNAARIIESKSGTSFNLGLRGFVGVEYFVLPRIALGGEFGWGLVYSTSGKSKITTESTNGLTVGEQEIEGAKTSGFGIDTDANNSVFGAAGTIRLTFHF